MLSEKEGVDDEVAAKLSQLQVSHNAYTALVPLDTINSLPKDAVDCCWTGVLFEVIFEISNRCLRPLAIFVYIFWASVYLYSP